MSLKACLGWLIVCSGLTPAAAGAMSLELHGERLDLAVRTTANDAKSPVIGSQADLSSDIKGVQFKVQLGVEAGAKQTAFQSIGISPLTRPGAWDSGRAAVTAVWAPNPGARFEFNVRDQLRRDFDRPDTIWADFSRRDVSARESQAGAAATFNPMKRLDLRVGANTSSRTVETVVAAATPSAASSSVLDTRSRSAFATLQWRPTGRLTFEGGGKMEGMGVAWKAAASGQSDYAFVEPRLDGTYVPWAGGSLKLGAERVVAPINTDQFVNFLQVANGSANSAFEPDREWRYRVEMQQRMFGEVQLAASFTSARLTSVTDLAPIGEAQGPADIGAGERHQVEARLTAPLRLPGWATLNLTARGAWRDSNVTDPFTGARRRLSGENAYDAEVALGQTLHDGRLRWGVTAHANGPASYYQMSQITTRSVAPGLGTFVEFNPGPVSLQLRLENLIGGEQAERDTYFAGRRDLGDSGRTQLIRNSNQSVKFTLARKL